MTTAYLTDPARSSPPSPGAPSGRIHRAWWVAAVAFVVLVAAGSLRATPSVLYDPLEEAFGWSRGTVSAAVSINLVLYGLTSPFAAALMERFGMRRVVAFALTLIAAGVGLTVFMTQPWQLILCWGVLVGFGAGSMALAFVATVTSRWFVRRRGLVTGILTAGGAAGQLVFLPLLAYLADHRGWKAVSITVMIAAISVVPLVILLLRNRPADVGTTAYGATAEEAAALVDAEAAAAAAGSAARRTIATLRQASHTSTFWLLAGTFAICGASTNGLIGTHFIPAAHDHGMPNTTAAGLLALIGVFDIAGTILSGGLTDRFDPRLLLVGYYSLRGLSLVFLPALFADTVQPSMVFFIVFYGLDWVATVPPTVALCRRHFGADGSIVFGWVFASHQVGAALIALGAGLVRDGLGDYLLAWYVAGGLCIVAAAMALYIGRSPTGERVGTTEPAIA